MSSDPREESAQNAGRVHQDNCDEDRIGREGRDAGLPPAEMIPSSPASSIDSNNSDLPDESTQAIDSTTSSVSKVNLGAAHLVPGRLHPLSVFFDVISHVRSLVIPAVIGILSAANGSREGLIFASILFCGTLAQSLIRYFSLRYQIKDSELIVTEGIFFRRNRTVPVSRIQNIDLTQNPLHRIFGVAEVRVETASGTEAEATLRVLSLARVEQLREGIFDRERRTATTAGDRGTVEEPETVQTLLRISSLQLLMAGLASNRGTILLGVIAGTYFQFDEQLEKMVDFGRFRDLVPRDATTIQIIAATALGVLGRAGGLSISWHGLVLVEIFRLRTGPQRRRPENSLRFVDESQRDCAATTNTVHQCSSQPGHALDEPGFHQNRNGRRFRQSERRRRQVGFQPLVCAGAARRSGSWHHCRTASRPELVRIGI